MSVPPLRLYNNFETFYSGEVIIHASAVIAPGVIMQAAPGSKIIIGSGVCIGMGSILQVDTGILEIESGANLGAGFLMVGAGKVGTNACVGSATTVFRSSVKRGEVVPAGSVIGDTSRTFSEPSPKEMNGRVKQPQLPVTEQLEQAQETQEADEPVEVEEIVSNSSNTSNASNSSNTPNASNTSNGTKPSIYTTPPVTPSPRPYVSPSPISYFSPVKDSTDLTPETLESEDSAEEPTNNNSNGVGNHIYGRSNIKSLLTTLFPHRQTLDTPDDESQEG